MKRWKFQLTDKKNNKSQEGALARREFVAGAVFMCE